MGKLIENRHWRFIVVNKFKDKNEFMKILNTYFSKKCTTNFLGIPLILYNEKLRYAINEKTLLIFFCMGNFYQMYYFSKEDLNNMLISSTKFRIKKPIKRNNNFN